MTSGFQEKSDRAEKRELRRQCIVDTAARLFAELGFSHCEMERLAAELQIAKGTLYLYFPGKEDLFLAMVDSPDAVLGLVAKTYAVLTGFLDEFRAAFPHHNVIHCPTAAFAPPELGCSLSEDEAGSLSPAMFERFCLPSLVAMSERYGGMFMHCCAKADAHYPLFASVPRLRGLNRVFQYPPGPGPALAQFAAETVHMVAWRDEAGIAELLDLARPDTRFLFDLGWQPLDSAAACLDRLRTRIAEGPCDIVAKWVAERD